MELVHENNQSEMPFPSDEDVISKMDKTNRMFSFNIDDIDKRIRIERLSREGEQLFLFHRKNNVKNILGYCNIHSQYYIVNSGGDIIGRIPISIGNPYSISLDYWLKDEYQGKGIGSVALEEVIRQIYEENEFDNIKFSSTKYPDINQTEIKSIDLEISDDNEASKRIATKNGFKKVGDRAYSLTKEKYKRKSKIDEKDFAQLDKITELTTLDMCDAENVLDKITEKDTIIK